MESKYKISKSELSFLIENIGIVAEKIRTIDLFGGRCYEVYFNTLDELDSAVLKLDNKKYSNIFGKLVESRINRKDKMLYVVPFKKR